ncbi:MAG: thioredoxin fold domain-containing protein [Spirochaetes bacterium]|nr:thioredoxin fold domain-containing protein [Spirochaetota bacterium]
MKKITILVVSMAIFWIFASCSKSSEQENSVKAAPVSGGAAVTWHDFNEGLKLASAKGKPVIMDFYADWCGWCRKMEVEVFADREVAAKLGDNYICVRLHTDRNPGETIKYKNHTLTKQEFAMMLGVQGLPTLVFLDRDGNLITKIPGFINKDMMLPLLSYIKDECYLNKVPFKEYMDGKAPCGKK